MTKAEEAKKLLLKNEIDDYIERFIKDLAGRITLVGWDAVFNCLNDLFDSMKRSRMIEDYSVVASDNYIEVDYKLHRRNYYNNFLIGEK